MLAPSGVATLCPRFEDICKDLVAPPTAKLGEDLARMFVCVRGGPCAPSLAHLGELAEAVLAVHGPSGDFEEAAGQPRGGPAPALFPFLNPVGSTGDDAKGAARGAKTKPAAAAAEVVVEALEQSLSDAEYAVAALRRAPVPKKLAKVSGQAEAGAPGRRLEPEAEEEDGEAQAQEASALLAQVDHVSARLRGCSAALTPLLTAALDPGRALERLFAVTSSSSPLCTSTSGSFPLPVSITKKNKVHGSLASPFIC